MVDDAELRRLVSGRWLMPLMAHLAERGGSRFAIMLARLGLSRSVLAASLEQLADAGWIRHNPGHGHPLRPEYLLTKPGERIAAYCSKVMAQRQSLGLEPGDLSRWTLPVVTQLDRDQARFSGLRLALAPITPRALSLTLKQMLCTRLAVRALEDDFPPIPIYSLSGRGRSLAKSMR